MLEGAKSLLAALMGIPLADKLLFLYLVLFLIYTFVSWIINYYRVQNVINWNKKRGAHIKIEIGWQRVVVTPIFKETSSQGSSNAPQENQKADEI